MESTSDWGLQFYQLAFITVSCDSIHPKLTLADPSNTNFKFTLSNLDETWQVPLPLFNCKGKAEKKQEMDFFIDYNPKKETIPFTFYYDSTGY